MNNPLKQSTAATARLGPFVTGSGASITDLVIQKADVRLSKNGGAFAAASADQGASDAGAPHDENGYYEISLDATDTNTLGRLRIAVLEAGALHVWQDFVVLHADIYDALVANTGNLTALLSVGTGAGQLNVSGGKAPATIAAGDIASGAITPTEAPNLDAAISTRAAESGGNVEAAKDAAESADTEIKRVPRSGTTLTAGGAARHELVGGTDNIDDVEIKPVP